MLLKVIKSIQTPNSPGVAYSPEPDPSTVPDLAPGHSPNPEPPPGP